MLPGYHLHQVCGASTSSGSGFALSSVASIKNIDLQVRHASKNKRAWELPTLLEKQTRREFCMQVSFRAVSLIGAQCQSQRKSPNDRCKRCNHKILRGMNDTQDVIQWSQPFPEEGLSCPLARCVAVLTSPKLYANSFGRKAGRHRSLRLTLMIST